MKKVFLCVILVMLCVSSAFGGATEDLLEAAKSGNTTPKMLQALIKLGANVNVKDKDGATALMWTASMNSNTEFVLSVHIST